MAKIKKGDIVVVISGSNRGLEGRVLEVITDKNKVIVEGVNRVKRHKKIQQSQRGSKEGGIETVESPIHISNVMLVDPSTKKGTRVGHRVETVERDGVERTVRVRVAKRSGKDV